MLSNVADQLSAIVGEGELVKLYGGAIVYENGMATLFITTL